MPNIGTVVVGNPTNIKTVKVSEPTQTSINTGLKNEYNINSVENGGTGNTFFTVNGVLLGEGANSITAVASNVEGKILTIDANGVPTFENICGGVF